MFIKKLWQGNYSLATSYWGFGVLGNIALAVPSAFIDNTSNTPANWALSIATLIYGIIVNVGIWRSATKYEGNAIWRVLAKVVVALAAAMLVFSVIVLSKNIQFNQKVLLSQECLLNEVLQASPGMEAQVWIAASVPCSLSSDENLLGALGYGRNYIDQLVEKNGGKLSFNAILLNEVIKAKKFYPIDKYQSLASCKLAELKRIKTPSPMASSLVDDYCVQYMVSNLAMKTGYDMTGAMNAGLGYVQILEFLEKKYPAQ